MLSVSIVTYKSDIVLLVKLLQSLADAIEHLPKKFTVDEIDIIDNSSLDIQSDPEIRRLNTFLPQLKYHVNHENTGYGSAHNLAIKQRNSKYHLILNPDVILAKDNLSQGLGYLERNPEVAAISPFAEDMIGNLLYLTKKYPSIIDLFLRALPSSLSRKIFTKKMAEYENRTVVVNKTIQPVSIISGCYMLCRRDFLLKAGLFNEKYFLYFEDFALSIELSKIGCLIYHPGVKIRHFGGKASRKGLKHIGYFIRSAVTFFNDYGWKII